MGDDRGELGPGLYGSRSAGLLLVPAPEGKKMREKKIKGRGPAVQLREQRRKSRGGGSAGKEEGLGSRGLLPTAVRKPKKMENAPLVCSWR